MSNVTWSASLRHEVKRFKSEKSAFTGMKDVVESSLTIQEQNALRSLRETKKLNADDPSSVWA